MRLLTNKHFSGDGLRVMFGMASIVVIIAGLKAAGPLIIPILLAIFLATVSYPLTRLMMRWHFPRFLSVFITVMLNCSLLVGLGFLLNYLASDLKRTIPVKYFPLMQEKYAQLVAFMRQVNLEDVLAGVNPVEDIQNWLTHASNFQQVATVSGQVLGAVASWLSVIVLILILMTFFLSEVDVYRKNVEISSQDGPNFRKVIKASEQIQRYLLIKTAISFLTGLLAGLLCYANGVDFPLLWGIVAFALNFIPTIGSIVAAIPPVLLALLVMNPVTALIVALGYLLINTILGSFLDPLLMGKQFGIATSVVLLSVIFWGWIWGPIGMLLAVPLTMIMKLAFENSRDLKWVATLISDAPKEVPEPVEGPPPNPEQ